MIKSSGDVLRFLNDVQLVKKFKLRTHNTNQSTASLDNIVTFIRRKKGL